MYVLLFCYCSSVIYWTDGEQVTFLISSWGGATLHFSRSPSNPQLWACGQDKMEFLLSLLKDRYILCVGMRACRNWVFGDWRVDLGVNTVQKYLASFLAGAILKLGVIAWLALTVKSDVSLQGGRFKLWHMTHQSLSPALLFMEVLVKLCFHQLDPRMIWPSTLSRAHQRPRLTYNLTKITFVIEMLKIWIVFSSSNPL